LQAAKHGIGLDEAKIYVTLFPCDNCAKEIVRAGIKFVYYWKTIDDSNKHGGETTQAIQDMFKNKEILVYQHIPEPDYLVAFRLYRHLDVSEKMLLSV
jgi:deoxycytidylate deaminase